jgi:nucleoside-diphosphate-sugar epimerase
MTVGGGRIVITGAAGLVGQNLIPRLASRDPGSIVAIDKHPANTRILRQLHPDIEIIEADLAQSGGWEDAFLGAEVLVLNHAQIGALDEQPFIDNNITATEHVLAAAKTHAVPYIVHISSSVVNSKARDFYTESKKAQEHLVIDSGIPACVLRPTLMFGWFDRKHVGWLARLMQRVPVFPIPGNGRYRRQPLYVGDFCSIVVSAMETPRPGQAFNISGQETIDYIDLIRAVKASVGARAAIVRIPYRVFWWMLKAYSFFDRDPPFTTKQLDALATPDYFEVIDWPRIFNVRATPLTEALHETFQDPVYSNVVLEF